MGTSYTRARVERVYAGHVGHRETSGFEADARGSGSDTRGLEADARGLLRPPADSGAPANTGAAPATARIATSGGT